MIPARLKSAGVLVAAEAGVASEVGVATLEVESTADVVFNVSVNPARTCWKMFVTAMMARTRILGTKKESCLQAFIMVYTRCHFASCDGRLREIIIYESI